jgi:hypothetical protein
LFDSVIDALADRAHLIHLLPLIDLAVIRPLKRKFAMRLNESLLKIAKSELKTFFASISEPEFIAQNRQNALKLFWLPIPQSSAIRAEHGER